MAINKKSKSADARVVQRTLEKLETMATGDIIAIRPFFVHIEELYDEHVTARGPLTRTQLVDKINTALPYEYGSIKRYWGKNKNKVIIVEDDFKRYRTHLPRRVEGNKDKLYASRYSSDMNSSLLGTIQ